MGHSLGEYSALCAAGVLSFPQALELVRRRGEIIKEVSAALDGTMMWVINLEVEKVVEICGAVCAPGNEVYVSAYDSPAQASISGRSAAVKTAARQMEQAGAIVYPLKFTGPYHSPLMAGAAARMAEVLGQYRFAEVQYPVIANRTARPYEGKSSVAQNLAQQLVSPINWRNSIAYVLEQGVKIAAEIGPKDVLKFLAKKNSDRLDAFAVDKDEDWNLLKQRLLIPQEEYVQMIGRCLGAAVSTKNKNPGNEKYEEEVIRPYNRMASFYERLLQSGELPTTRQAEEALRILRAVFQAKQVASQDQEKKFARILSGRRLSPHFDISAE
jgi:[acyl-carrier-protein] S-malonyltransferase